MAKQRINKSNLLNKICFCRFNSGIESDGKRLEKDLKAHLRYHGELKITRQAIGYWFSKGSKPQRREAFEFLQSYVEDEIDYSSRNDNQKKVYKDIVDYFQSVIASLKSSPSFAQPVSGVVSSGYGNVQLINNTEEELLNQFVESWQSTYISFRRRLIDSKTMPIAREVVRISRLKNVIRYQHWHRRDGYKVERFEGFASIKAQSTWFFGASIDNRRYRVCHFKNNFSMNPAQRALRWGLMHSDIPTASSHEPASTRIVLSRFGKRIMDFDEFLNETVNYISVEDVDEDIRDFVARAIDNNLAAASLSDSIEAIANDESVLQVNQKTLETFCSD